MTVDRARPPDHADQPRARGPAVDGPRADIVFEADCVGKRWGDRRVLTAASFRAAAGRIAVLLGRNGCGKSTLLRAATGFVRPDWGVFRLHGRVLQRPRLHALARAGLFYIPERDLLTRNRTLASHFLAISRAFHDRAPRDTLADVLRPPAPGTQTTRFETAIELLGVGALLDRYPHQLSTGERRRAEFALAVARDPACLLADEPFQGIAPRDVEVIAAGLRTLAGQGCAIVLTGHEVTALLALADEILWMVAGTTHSLGSPERAALHDQFRRAYLGSSGAPHSSADGLGP